MATKLQVGEWVYRNGATRDFGYYGQVTRVWRTVVHVDVFVKNRAGRWIHYRREWGKGTVRRATPAEITYQESNLLINELEQ